MAAPPAATLVTPIDHAQQQRVRAATEDCLQRAGAHFGCRFTLPILRFDLRGRAAGLYQVRGGACSIRYNPWLFAKYLEDNLRHTVPHEVAHHVVYQRHGVRRIRPHGSEWQAVMHLLGVEPARTCSYDLDGVPLRQQRLYPYQCRCGSVNLSARRHLRIVRGHGAYLCRRCRSELTPNAA